VHYLNRSKDPEMRCQELEKLANACCACALYPVMHMAWDVSVMVGALLSPSAAYMLVFLVGC